MRSSQEEAISVIMEWTVSGTVLDLVFTGLGITMKEFGVRVKVDGDWGVLRINKSPADPFEAVSSPLRDWTPSESSLPDGRRGVKMLSSKGEVLFLAEAMESPPQHASA
jgi:hypothetical protein